MTEETSGDLRLTNVTKRYDTFTAVDQLELEIPRGSFFALLGPSGCGKTTTLRMVAGLDRPTIGQIWIGDKDITDTKAYQRNVNTVFQNYALFPHLSVIDNVAFGLRRRKVSDHRAMAMEALELVQLAHIAKKKPGQLSGGMQQRVALARAIVNRPDVLLLDEPLGALDLKLRRQMQIELKIIQSEVGLTFVHVTHDQEEAMTMADTIAVMNRGHLEQVGDPATLYEKPKSTFVANFLGQSNLLEATVKSRAGSIAELDVHGVSLRLPVERLVDDASSVWLGVRPEKLRLVAAGATHDGSAEINRLTGVVTDASFTGLATNYLIRLPWGQELMVVQHNDGTPRAAAGAQVTLGWAPEHGFALDAKQDAHAGAQDQADDSGAA
ncbi:MAG TPA: ABC transporter ATP-binding protein [Dermatophilaceae bacterium]|nr:ABC transporter ATP-binding protein [Dermatophilaceae bacterium]